MQRCNRPLIPLLLGVVVAVIPGRSIAQVDTQLKNRFYAEAPDRWEEYLRFGRGLQVTVTATRYEVADGKRSPVQSIRHEYKQAEGATLRVYQPLEPEGEAEAEGANPSYSFQLKRRNAEGGWVITGLNTPSQSADDGDEQSRLQEKNLHDVCHCLRLWNLWLPTLIHDPDFKLTSLTTEQYDGARVVRAAFEYPKRKGEYPRRGSLPLQGGWMVLDPEHDWVLREYLVHTGDPNTHFIHRKFQIKQGAQPHPIVTKTTTRIVAKDEAPPEVVFEAQYETREQSDVPLSAFRLSAFGLPEPPGLGTGRSRPRLYMWIVLAGIVCLSLAALFRWLARRAA